MKLRVKLIAAFLLLSFVPLTVVVLYSYYTSQRAFRQAVEAEAVVMAEDLGKRMEATRADLRRQIHRLSELPFRRLMAQQKSLEAELQPLLGQVVSQIGQAATMIDALEFVPEPGAVFQGPPPGRRKHSTGAEPHPVPEPYVIHLKRMMGDTDALVRLDTPPAPAVKPGEPPPGQRSQPRKPSAAALARVEADRKKAEETRVAVAALRKKADLLGKWVESWSRLDQKEKTVLEQRRANMKLLFARDLDAAVERDGKIVGKVKGQISTDEVLRGVLKSSRRQQREIPFAVDAEGKIYTAQDDDLQKIKDLPLESVARTGKVSRTDDRMSDWTLVTRKDPDTGLTFGIARPIGETLQEIRRTAAVNLGYGLGMIGLALLGILPLSGRMTRNLNTLIKGAEELARGKLDVQVPVRSADEFGKLAQTFNRMARDLSAHQKQLLQQEALKKELEMCRRIQEELLPRGSLRFGSAEVRGVSIPAREVGGDFFNYFALPGGDIALLVGDVSGKGLPAALLMANLQATLKARLMFESDLARLAEDLDREVEASTPAEVYLTLFMAVLDSRGGRLRYINAGHNPQLVRRWDGSFQWLESTGRPLGLLSGGGYTEEQVDLTHGDCLLLYTDGLVEAESASGEEFGTSRLEEVLAGDNGDEVDAIIARIEGAVRRHRRDSEASDDATIVVLKVAEAAHQPEQASHEDRTAIPS